MTLPTERTQAILRTEDFLLSLQDRKRTPRVPAEVRAYARALLRHYPTAVELELVALAEAQSGEPRQLDAGTAAQAREARTARWNADRVQPRSG